MLTARSFLTSQNIFDFHSLLDRDLISIASCFVRMTAYHPPDLDKNFILLKTLMIVCYFKCSRILIRHARNLTIV